MICQDRVLSASLGTHRRREATACREIVASAVRDRRPTSDWSKKTRAPKPQRGECGQQAGPRRGRARRWSMGARLPVVKVGLRFSRFTVRTTPRVGALLVFVSKFNDMSRASPPATSRRGPPPHDAHAPRGTVRHSGLSPTGKELRLFGHGTMFASPSRCRQPSPNSCNKEVRVGPSPSLAARGVLRSVHTHG